MILNFRHNGLRSLWERGDGRHLPPEYADKIQRILDYLNDGTALANGDGRRYRLHRLRGNLAGYWAVSVSANWRIIFRSQDGDVCDVELIDYH